jgi:hypothetical protein
MQGRLKDTGRRDDSHDDLLFPPERGEHGSRCELRKRNYAYPDHFALLIDPGINDLLLEFPLEW